MGVSLVSGKGSQHQNVRKEGFRYRIGNIFPSIAISLPSSTTGLKIIAGTDSKSIRLRATGGQYEIGLDGRNAPGLKPMNLLGQAVPQARVSRQKIIIPIGN